MNDAKRVAFRHREGEKKTVPDEVVVPPPDSAAGGSGESQHGPAELLYEHQAGPKGTTASRLQGPEPSTSGRPYASATPRARPIGSSQRHAVVVFSRAHSVLSYISEAPAPGDKVALLLSFQGQHYKSPMYEASSGEPSAEAVGPRQAGTPACQGQAAMSTDTAMTCRLERIFHAMQPLTCTGRCPFRSLALGRPGPRTS